MSLARAWTRQISGAYAAALLVPCAIFASVLVLALTGGFGQLRRLDQAFGGPSAPAALGRAATGATAGGAPTAPAPLLPVAAASTTATAARSTVSTAAGTAPVQGPGTSAPGANPGGGLAPVNQPSAGGTGPPQSTGTGSPPPAPVSGPPPTQPPSRPPTLVDQVVNLGTSVTGTLPAPVGPLATQVLQGAGQAVDNTLSGVTSGAARLLSGNRTQ